MSVDQPPTEIAAEPPTPGQVQRRTRNHPFGFGQCPECMEEFVLRHPNQLFCRDRHRDDWRARDTKRGRQVFALDMVARITRGGTRGTEAERAIGKKARQEASTLRQRWKDEDRKAGRMGWAIYLTRRFAIGFDPLA